jgi:hypothetical protein
MKASLVRRCSCVEGVRAAQRRTHFLWQNTDETYDVVRARIDAMIASGEASRNDRFVTFSWRSDADDGAEN